MIVEPSDDTEGHELLAGFRELVQNVFRDTETLQVDAKAVYDTLQKLNISGKAQISQYLKKIERDGKFSRTKLDDLIHELEEVADL